MTNPNINSEYVPRRPALCLTRPANQREMNSEYEPHDLVNAPEINCEYETREMNDTLRKQF